MELTDDAVTVTYTDGTTERFHHVIRMLEFDWWYGCKHPAISDDGVLAVEHHTINPDAVRSIAAPSVATDDEGEQPCRKYYASDEPPGTTPTWRADFHGYQKEEADTAPDEARRV